MHSKQPLRSYGGPPSPLRPYPHLLQHGCLLLAAGLLLLPYEAMGRTLPLLDGLLLALHLRTRPHLLAHAGYRWAGAGLLLSAGMHLLVSLPVAGWIHQLSLLLLLAVAWRRELRFAFFGLLLLVLGVKSVR